MAARMFGLKDVFTTINLLGGAIALCLCVLGQPWWAGVAVMLGYVCGDVPDGWVARKLNSANAFGAEYDTIADHLSHVIAPSVIVFTVYRDAGLVPAPWDTVLAMALASSMMIAVSVRHARNVIAPVEYKGVWTGLPRSVLGFAAIGYCNATLAPHAPGGWWIGVVLIPALALFTLSYVPFPSHHLVRGHHWLVTVIWKGSFVVTIALTVIWPAFLFDIIFFWMFGYSLSAWISLTADERAHHRTLVAAAKLRAAA